MQNPELNQTESLEAVVTNDQQQTNEQQLEKVIKSEIAKYNFTDAKIQELKEKFSTLAFTNLEDKANTKLIKASYSEIKKYRTNLENKRKELKANYLETGRRIDAEAKRIKDLLLEIEEPLSIEAEKIKEAEEAEKIKKEQEKKAFLLKRVETLETAGLKFDDVFYSLGNISLDISTIEQLPQEQFENLLTRVSEEKERLEKAEADRIREEAEKAEAEKVAAEKAEKERQQLEAEKAEIIKMRIESRTEYFLNIGFVKHVNELNNNSEFFFLQIGNKNLTFQVQDIGEMTMPQWNDFKEGLDEMIDEAKEALRAEQEAERKRQHEEEQRKQKAKEEAEKAEAERIAFEEAEKLANEVLKTRSKQLEENGFVYSHSLSSFLFTNKIGAVELTLDKVKYTANEIFIELFESSLETVKDLKNQQSQAEQEQRRIAESQQIEAEKSRLANLGDKEKVTEHFNKLRAVMESAPTLELQKINESFKQLNDFILDQLEKFENRF